MLKLETKADLERLYHNKIQESFTLDYKDSRALKKQDAQRNELCKDVSAFANSAGGQIIYGMTEKDQEPKGLDSGVPNNEITREWIEQVINSNVEPRIDGLVITPIPFDDSNTGYVLTIPQAVVRAPHQAHDHKYYKRQNFQSVPMEDYEIRDAFRRSTNAEPFVSISFVGGRTKIDVELEDGAEHSKPIELKGIIGNASSQPAYYSVFTLYLDDRFIGVSAGGSIEGVMRH
jgi:predicted HTH transcriptional regulator